MASQQLNESNDMRSGNLNFLPLIFKTFKVEVIEYILLENQVNSLFQVFLSHLNLLLFILSHDQFFIASEKRIIENDGAKLSVYSI